MSESQRDTANGKPVLDAIVLSPAQPPERRKASRFRITLIAAGALVAVSMCIWVPVVTWVWFRSVARSFTEPSLNFRGASMDLGVEARSQDVWLTDLAAGREQAQRREQPIFVRVNASGIGACTELEQAVRQPLLQDELARWTLVSVDAGRLDKDAAELNVGQTFPAMRLLTSAGRLVAARDGYAEPEQLAAWLRENYAKAADLPDDAPLAVDGPLTAAAVTQLVEELKARDAAQREAAIRRLLSQPKLAAPPVVEAFTKGTLQTRLAAFELLRAWKAPLADVDPWSPENLSPPRVQALQNWAADGKQLAAIAVPAGAALTAAERKEVRRDLARLVQAPDAEALAIRERLARYGSVLLPEVHAQLKDAATDQARERLTALRYRLVASNVLVRTWPGGLERLAATNVNQRHQAAQELVVRVTKSDEPLLLELFTDPDPLVREISLRGLHKIAGHEAATSLTRLLGDPDPNVRAAVLKQLAEKPTPALLPALRDYLAREKDVDLLVHAARVLRGIENKDSIDGMKELLKHPSWRVRAEAAEGLGAALKRERNGNTSTTKDEMTRVMVATLKDEDGFVVGRAVKALSYNESADNVEPMLEAARKHPELTAEVINTLNNNYLAREKVLPHLRKFCSHANADARAAAIKGLCNATSEVETEMSAALKDPSSTVRIAAAGALFKLLDARRGRTVDLSDARDMPAPSSSGGILGGLRRLFGGEANEEKGEARTEVKPMADDPDAALRQSRAGKGRPKWMAKMVDLLLPMLVAPAPEERLAAAAPLVAFARDEQALPVLLAVAKTQPALQGQASEVLPWLPWEQRLTFYKQLLELRPPAAELAEIVRNLASTRDARVAPLLWDLAGKDDAPEVVGALLNALRQTIFGDDYNRITNNRRQVSNADRKEAAVQARPRVMVGSETQRVLALALLVTGEVAAVVPAAVKVLADDDAPAELRGDALQILLVLRSPAEASRTALTALSHPQAVVRSRALWYLTGEGDWHFKYIRDGAVSLDLEEDSRPSPSSIGEGRPWTPILPPGLKAEMLQPLLRDGDPRIAARAGYLLVLLGDAAGMEPLLGYWRERAHDEEAWAELVYRAVTALGDDSRVPILEEIFRLYAAGTYSNVSNFYWTIRKLEGPSARRLRKLIQQEMGMERLR